MNRLTYALTACIFNGVQRADSSLSSDASSCALAASGRSDPYLVSSTMRSASGDDGDSAAGGAAEGASRSARIHRKPIRPADHRSLQSSLYSPKGKALLPVAHARGACHPPAADIALRMSGRLRPDMNRVRWDAYIDPHRLLRQERGACDEDCDYSSLRGKDRDGPRSFDRLQSSHIACPSQPFAR